MVTVWCLSWGDKYPDYYVQRLKRETEKYLSVEHRFVCITDHDIEGVQTMPPQVDWPGWWGKIQLFKPGLAFSKVNLWLDLDIVLTGSLDSMIETYGGSHFACAKNWAQSGHGGCQSSVMIWHGGKGCQAEIIYRLFDPKDARWPPSNDYRFWGDQEFITHLRNTGHLAVTHFDPALIQSYKYHCRGKGLPAGCAAVVFHGDPKPAEVNESWFEW